MSITFVAGDAQTATSMSLPAGWQAGDVALVVGASNAGSGMATPSGWTTLASPASDGTSTVTQAYRVLQAGDTTTGNWGGTATQLCCVIYRGVTSPPVGFNAGTIPASGSIKAWAQSTYYSKACWTVNVSWAHGGSVKSNTATGVTTRSGGFTIGTFWASDTNGPYPGFASDAADQTSNGGTNSIEFSSLWPMADGVIHATSGTQSNTSGPTPGWTSPANATAVDAAFATALNGSTSKSVTDSGDFAFADFSSVEVPNGATINGVYLMANAKLSAAVTGGAFGLNGVLNSVAGTAVTKTTTPVENVVFKFASVPTVADLQAASTHVLARCQGIKGSTTSALTVSMDVVSLAVDLTPAGAGDPTFPYQGSGGYYGTFREYAERARKRFWRSGWERRPSGVLVPV